MSENDSNGTSKTPDAGLLQLWLAMSQAQAAAHQALVDRLLVMHQQTLTALVGALHQAIGALSPRASSPEEIRPLVDLVGSILAHEGRQAILGTTAKASEAPATEAG